KIKELKFAEYNSRKSSKEQEEALRRSLEKFGYVEPKYCDMIIKRYEKLAGDNAVRADGVKFGEIKAN
ncbi:MAG: hypothetical protein LBF97_00760, partial [Elusimicrobiota bacterium]|nr:hypothetical protein [Elusimicrobiota bacterium]